MRLDLTAIVVNWNAGDRIRTCVDSVRNGGGDPSVIVVDNGSTDGSLEGLRDLPGVRLIETGENLGYGRAANRGIRAATTEYVAILNPDLVLAPGALSSLAAFLARDGRRSLVGPRLVDERGRVLATCGQRPGVGGAICRKFLLHLVLPPLRLERPRPPAPCRVAWVTGACMVARRSALKAIGGFDEAIFMYFEDVDLCLRLCGAGSEVWYLPAPEARHAGGQSSKQALDRMLLASEQSWRYFSEKHFGPGGARVLSALTPVEMALRSLLWGAIYATSASRRGEAASRLRAYRRAFTNDLSGAAPPAGPAASVQDRQRCFR